MTDTVCDPQLLMQCVIKWPMVYLQGYRSLSPERMQGNGLENWVHLVEHLLAKCKQTETGSSPTTGAAVSKNDPVAQQPRNPAELVTSAVKDTLHMHISTTTTTTATRGSQFVLIILIQVNLICN